MTWEAVATAHSGHRALIRDSRTLDCECGQKLILPRDPNAGTPTPKPYRAPSQRVGVPMPGNFRARVWADLKHKREQAERRRTTVEEGEPR